MKKLLVAIALLASTALYAASPSPSVDEKIEKSFNSAFPKAEKVTWYENETYYEVLFMNDMVKCRMWYKKYMVDKNLSDLEEELDKETFFRVNRQYILNINYVKSYKSYDRVKLQVDLLVNAGAHNIVISQETAPLFKKWIYEA